MMDRLAIEAAKAATGLDWPDVGAALLMDVDGPAAEVEDTLRRAPSRSPARRARSSSGCPRSEAERQLMWKGRKSAFAAVGRISPNYMVEDGVIPRSEIAPVLREIEAMATDAGLRVANVFHAGDGNLHPLVLYDARNARRGGAGRATWAGTSCACACGAAAPSPASTAWAPRRPPTWPTCSARPTSRP